MKHKILYIALPTILLAIITISAFSIYYGPYVSIHGADANIDMKLVYAYFWVPSVDNNANLSSGSISYITVINITNSASQTAYVTDVTIEAAQNVTVYSASANASSVSVSHNSSHVFLGVHILVTGISLDDERDGLQLRVESGSYRLVAVTGVTTSTDFFGSRELFLKVSAEPAYVKGESTGIYDIQDLSIFQHTSNGILYNVLLIGNETLSISGLDASINYPG